MADWKDVNLHGATFIERIVSVYQLGAPARLPIASFKIKVIERPGHGFLGVPNVAVKQNDGSVDWVSGIGANEQEALDDTLKWFMGSFGDRVLGEEDLEWADPHDF